MPKKTPSKAVNPMLIRKPSDVAKNAQAASTYGVIERLIGSRVSEVELEFADSDDTLNAAEDAVSTDPEIGHVVRRITAREFEAVGMYHHQRVLTHDGQWMLFRGRPKGET